MNTAKKARFLFCCAMISLSLRAPARGVRLWSDGQLMGASDLVVVATPIETKDLQETTSLGWDTGRTGVRFRGVVTTFKVFDVIKGICDTNRIVLHHYREDGISVGKVSIPAVTNGPVFMIPSTLDNGPGFIGFVLNETNRLVLYLVKDGPSRYAPVTGQIDPERSFRPSNKPEVSTAEHNPSAKQYFENYLNQCGTNEIRCLWFLDNNPRVAMVMTIDLSRETVFTAREVYDFAEEAAETRTLSHSQVLNLKETMNALPMPDSDNDFSESVFESVRSGERTLVFRYNRRYIPPTLRRIYDIAGGYLESSNTTSYDGKDLGAALRKIAEQIPELAVDSITNAPALPDVAWNGDAVARAFFLMPKHLRYMTNIMDRGPRQLPMMDLEVTAVRYDSSKDAEQAVKGSLRGRQVAPQSKENYRGFTLYRFAPEYGNVICQAGQYVVEVLPFSEAAVTLVMKTLDVVLAGLPKIADGKETRETQ